MAEMAGAKALLGDTLGEERPWAVGRGGRTGLILSDLSCPILQTPVNLTVPGHPSPCSRSCQVLSFL